MSAADDKAFAGSIPALYEADLVPLIFESYADDLAQRVQRLRPARVLEIAAGTGAVTRRLAEVLPAGTTIVATDLNQAMLDQAATRATAQPVTWRQADALELPFNDGEFDVVVCQFGVMFFPDHLKVYAEMRRVLTPGGTVLFNVWDRLSDNEFADVITTALAEVFPEDPPRFLPRAPYGYHDVIAIRRTLEESGLSVIGADTVTARSRAATADVPARGFCLGSPLRNEIIARGATRLDEATPAARKALERKFGATNLDGRIQAIVFTATRR